MDSDVQGPQTQRDNRPFLKGRGGLILLRFIKSKLIQFHGRGGSLRIGRARDHRKTARLSRSHRSLRHNNYLSRFSVSFAGFFIRWVQAGWAEAVCRSWLRQWQRESASYLCDKRALCLRCILPERHEISNAGDLAACRDWRRCRTDRRWWRPPERTGRSPRRWLLTAMVAGVSVRPCASLARAYCPCMEQRSVYQTAPSVQSARRKQCCR